MSQCKAERVVAGETFYCEKNTHTDDHFWPLVTLDEYADLAAEVERLTRERDVFRDSLAEFEKVAARQVSEVERLRDALTSILAAIPDWAHEPDEVVYNEGVMPMIKRIATKALEGEQ